MTTTEKNEVNRIDAADPAEALAHFSKRLEFETDCWDVHSTQEMADR